MSGMTLGQWPEGYQNVIRLIYDFFLNTITLMTKQFITPDEMVNFVCGFIMIEY